MSPDITTEIITLEWEMFQKVNANGPRASCQDDAATFNAMRRAQFDAWSADARESYYMDLTLASLEGRNLVMEKYALMMKGTDPAAYAEISEHIRMPSPRA